MADSTKDEPQAPGGDGRTEHAPAQAEGAPTATTGDERATADETGQPVVEPAERVEELEARVAELEDNWRRAVAELHNYRKRMARELAAVAHRERIRVCTQWLAVVDNLDRALEHADTAPASVVDGVRAVRDEALRILEGFGFPRQETEPGSSFDPLRHEAVATVADDEIPEGAIVHVTRPGYGEGDNQLRPAMVVVSSGKQ
ncbi:nucleotide exchange factor GrpE [Thermasporomyces composti]|jgi:molecular chaperone GrpE|uniref:Protein GrpE n=1 Tax=Thermasporomyces composti TaxID=696763 RepID=A0A3D9VDQ9_THECX|nr:nucleotide exchange factor GrpE [Thermasporomyces composti]REF35451.1 molecular chaperone GrpE [Thermasporomyces composti]